MVEITNKQLFISCLAISRIIEEYDEAEISAWFDCSTAELENLLEEMDEIAEKAWSKSFKDKQK